MKQRGTRLNRSKEDENEREREREGKNMEITRCGNQARTSWDESSKSQRNPWSSNANLEDEDEDGRRDNTQKVWKTLIGDDDADGQFI